MKIESSNVTLGSNRMYYESTTSSHTNGTSVGNSFSNALWSQMPPATQDRFEIALADDSDYFMTYQKRDVSATPLDTSAIRETSDSNETLHDMQQIRYTILKLLLERLLSQSQPSFSSRFQRALSDLQSQMYAYSTVSTYSTTTYYHEEFEQTSFSAQGLAQTEDGRTLSFQVDVGMSRSFMEYANYTQVETYSLIDPLVLQVGNKFSSLSDQTFFFDLDADGQKENISKLSAGSAFLSYDKNGDGIINDGSELFGAISGNGFSELAAFDEDGNGWIDENDAVFSKLSVWFKDDTGEDKLIKLLDADVGAIYLGNASTEYTQRGSDFHVNGQLKSSGIYLKECGGVGLVQQIDLASHSNAS